MDDVSPETKQRLAREAAEQAELDRVMNMGHEPGGVLNNDTPKKVAKPKGSQWPQGQRKYKPKTETGQKLNNAITNRQKMLNDL